MSDVLDWDRWEAELGTEPAPQITLGNDGRPLDPAQTRAYDDQQQLRIQRGHLAALDADRQARAERRAERQELEQHWARETHAHALFAQQRAQTQLPVQYHVHYMIEVPAQHQPVWQQVSAEDLRREDRTIAIGLAVLAVLCVGMVIVLAAAFHGQGVNDARRHTPTTQVAP